MEYREYPPRPALAPYVKRYWVLRGERAAPPVDRIFPDGCTELIFHRGGRFAQGGTDGRLLQQPKSLYFFITYLQSFCFFVYERYGFICGNSVHPRK